LRVLAALPLALGVPVLAHAYLAYRVDHGLEPAFSRALGVPVEVGSVDSRLTGLVVVSDLEAGPMSADSIEVAFDPFGLEPGEVRVNRPRARIAIAADGTTSLDPVLERLRASTGPAAGRPGHRRRIAITGGDLEVDLAGRARLRAAGLELAGGRLVSRQLELSWQEAGWQARARFARASADVAGRFAAVKGVVSLAAPDGRRIEMDGAVLSAGISGPGLRLVGPVRGGGEVDLAVHPAGARIRIDHLPLAFATAALGSRASLDGARASGTIALDRAPGGLTAAADLTLDGAHLDHPLLALEPVQLDGALRARGSITRSAGRWFLALDQLALRRAALSVHAEGLIEWRSGLPDRGQLLVWVPETSCAGALAAIPRGLRRQLAGMALDGVVAGSVALSFDRSIPEATDLAMAIDVDGCTVTAEPVLADPLRLAAPFDHRLADGEVIRVGDGPDHAPLARLPGHLVGAFIAAEDARFRRHNGFDPEQIERSLAIDLDSGRLLRGGSTISQQLVKNVFLGHERTLARKLQEAIITWRVEARVGKPVILGRYLDLIELGPGVHGIGAAARHWFGRPPQALGVRQAAFLAALTPAPRTLSKVVRASGGLAPEIDERVNIVLRAMRISGVIDRATYDRALREPLRLAPTALAAR
jgi:hypothetical protein